MVLREWLRNHIRNEARAELLRCFPRGYRRVNTPGTNLECGLYALLLSITHQFPDIAPLTIADLRRALELALQDEEVLMATFAAGYDFDNLSIDQLALIA